MSRSEGDVRNSEEEGSPERDYLLQVGGRRHRDDVEFNELDIKLRVSYKTLLLAFVLFDVFHRVVNSLSDSSAIQGIIPW